jgi:threonine aldolase
MQLASKNRFIAVQFQALLQNGLWQEIAEHTNNLATTFKEALAGIPAVEVVYPVETNAVFIKMPRHFYDKLQEFASFYFWNEEKNEYRLIFSFDSKMEEITSFIERLRDLAGK